MHITEFIDLVQQMRTAQKEYFATRNRTVLERSKALERQIDIAISSGDIKPQKVDYSCDFNPPDCT
jgi:hypothetical protein